MQLLSLICDDNPLSKNEKIILEKIWTYGPVSRKVLSELTGLTGASATRLTKKLIDSGIVQQNIERSGVVGNPSRPLSRAGSGVYTLGLSFDKTHIWLQINDLFGNEIEATEIQTDSISISSLEHAITSTISNSHVLHKDNSCFAGVGIAVPGYRAAEHGSWAVHWDFPELVNIDLESDLATRLALPVFAERDALAAAWAERFNGRGKSTHSFFSVYLAQGVGGALMVNGLPMLGAFGNAGGMGALFPYDEPRPSTYDLRNFLALENIGMEDVEQDTTRYEDVLDRWVDHIIPNFRKGLGLISRLYDPEQIVISGLLPSAAIQKLIEAVDLSALKSGYTAELPKPEIHAGANEKKCLLMGAASLPIAKLISP